MQNVRRTLLKGLFLETPPYMGEFLVESSSRVFPGREGFVRFLEETDSQKRTAQARLLLMRLCRESGLLIPTRLLLSVLEAEEQYAPRIASAAYVPQDHFAHLVHLYLLGIFVFTHHKKFNRIVASYFERLRQQVGHTSSVNSDEAAFEDFVFAWRAFVLLHDIAYPHELQLIHGNPLLLEIRARYWRLEEEIADETAISFLSRMASWQLADDLSHPVQCASVAGDLFDPKEARNRTLALFPAELPSAHQTWREARRLPILHGRRFLALCMHVCPREQILALLIHSRTGRVALALVPNNGRGHVVHTFDAAIKTSVEELGKLAFELGITPRLPARGAEYEWQLFSTNYAESKEGFIEKLSDHANRYVNPERLQSVCRALSDEASAPTRAITSDADFRAYEHWADESLHLWLHEREQSPRDRDGKEYTVVSNVARALEHRIAERLSTLLRRRIEESLKRGGGGVLRETGVAGMVRSALAPVLRDEHLVDDLATELETELHSGVDRELMRWRVLDDLRRIAGTLVPAPPHVSSGAPAPAAPGAHRWRHALDAVDVQASALDRLLDDSTLPPMRTLLEAYRPSYLGPDDVDHGLASTILVLQLAKHASSIADRLRRGDGFVDKSLASLASIALCVGDETSADDLSYRASTLLSEVARATALHNLYPAELESLGRREFRVQLSREPFCFFAILMDSLQAWDRDRRLWQSRTTLPHKVAGDGYDVSIRDDLICVHERDHGLDITKRANAIKTGLDSFMQGASEFIGLELAQWRSQDVPR